MLICADARRIPLANGSVQCVVTSPPYWGLRKYAGEQELIWEPADMDGCPHKCVHEWAEELSSIGRNDGGRDIGGRGGNYKGDGPHRSVIERGTCVKCGAWRGAFGLEPVVEMYVAHTIEVLREVRRVLRRDGVCFWNIGDSYAAQGGAHNGRNDNQRGVGAKRTHEAGAGDHGNRTAPSGLKPKDLCLIPMRVALAAQGFATIPFGALAGAAGTLCLARQRGDWDAVAQVEGLLRAWSLGCELRADGWWVRSVIIWAKPNPMPESVTDRPTDAYEHILMLTKSARYFWDAEAVKENAAWERWGAQISVKRNNGAGWMPDRTKQEIQEIGGGSRNLRNVWTFATQPYSGAHFATFPEELPRRCILAATSAKGACRFCGAPWERVVKASGGTIGKSWHDHGNDMEVGMSQYDPATQKGGVGSARDANGQAYSVSTIGWKPTCECRGQHGRTVPCVVLDPFGGSGTTGRVATELNRNAVLLDLAFREQYKIWLDFKTHEEMFERVDYVPLAKERTAEVQRELAI